MEDDNPFTKAKTIDPEVRAYVYSLVNALGGNNGDEDGRYVLGDDALSVLRDLKRWLKLYDEKTNRLDVARCLAEAKIVTGDLLPILASWPEDKKNDKVRARLALACLELLVPLTWPIEHGEMTVNHHRHMPYLQQAQVIYKAGILTWDNTKILRQVIRISLPSIAIRKETRSSRDEGIIKLMLYFIRNVATIRQIPNLPSQGLENEVSRSATIEAFRDQDVFALLLTLCSNIGEEFNLQDVIILEILFNLVKGVDVEKLWMTEAQRKGQDVSDLKATLNEEDSLHREAKKNEWSRHGRFGTMIWIKREGDKVSAVSGQDNLRSGRTALFNIDKSKKWSKPERKQKDLDHTINDFDRKVRLTSSASEKLRNFVEEFLDSGFNPLITHLRRAIEREADRLLDINYRQFFYIVGWFLQAERLRRERQKKEVKPACLKDDFAAESYALVAAVLNQETFITMNRYMQNSLDNKEWQDLNACMRCFTQILLTVQDMSQSSQEEDQEIAENIQNRIFYEETTHDRIANLLKGYKDQGFGYLDACTELSHVFLRLLERYSKENADLQIRSRQRARQKKKKDANPNSNEEDQGQGEDEASENEDVTDVVQVSRERKFDFKRFAAKFTSQSSVDTFIALTTFFKELSVEQLKRAHRFFYRVAFKQESAVLLYRVDVIALFYKMIQGPDGLSRKHSMYTEWSEFSKQLLRKMFKKLDQRPELFVELLFSKINKTLYYLEHGHDKATQLSTRAPANLEIKPAPGRDKKEQIGIMVTILQKDEKADLVTWVKSILAKAFDERHGWEAEAEARKLTAVAEARKDGTIPSTETWTEKPSYITVRPTSPEIQTAMFKNARLKLLMKLVGFEIQGTDESIDATWIIPEGVMSSDLFESKEVIEQFEVSPWQPENPDDAPEDMLRRVRNVAPRIAEDGEEEEARRDAFIDDSEGEDRLNDEEFLFPDNIRTRKPRDVIEELKAKRKDKKRKRGSDSDDADDIDEELAAKRRQARTEAALERRRKIKSELYIRDSDDETDEERDREFFAREEQLRKNQTERIKRQMALTSGNPLVAAKADGRRRKPKNKGVSTAIRIELDSDEDVLMQDQDTVETDAEETVPSSQTITRDESEESGREEETPLSSPRRSESGNDPPLKQIPQPRAPISDLVSKKITSEAELGDDSDNDAIVSKVPRRTRAGFIVDSDDDDE